MTAYQDRILESLDELSNLLLSEETLDTTLARVVDLASRVVESCHASGVTLVRGGAAETAAATDPEIAAIDAKQYDDIGEGPCLSAIEERSVFRIDDMAAESRWPEFCSLASSHGLHSLIAYPLVVRDEPIGALNLYSREVAGFADEDQALGEIFTAQASIAIANSQLYAGAVTLTSQLEEALESRAVIERAKGMLMERESCSADEAFELLRTASQHLNRKLRDVARDIVERRR